MQKFLIERTLPGAGDLTPDQLKSIAQTSCTALRNLGPDIQWIESFVTPNKIYCVYLSKSADLIREHAKQGGFPADSVEAISEVISPATAG